MQGPPLSPREVSAHPNRYISKLETLGLSRDAAIAATAEHFKADAAKVADLVGGPG